MKSIAKVLFLSVALILSAAIHAQNDDDLLILPQYEEAMDEYGMADDTDEAVTTVEEFHFGDAEEQTIDFLGLPLFDGPGLWRLLILFGINLLVCWIITHFFYYPKSRRRDYYFTYMLFSTAIFLILYNLQNMKIEVGIALGLFGIFSMIRYRTEQLHIREMTYLFVLIAISIINGAGMATSYASFIVVNVIFIVLVSILEGLGFSHRQATKIITYEKIELIVPEKHDQLMADLKARTGLDIVSIQIGSINFLKDTAFIKVTYIPTDPMPNDIDMVTKFKSN